MTENLLQLGAVAVIFLFAVKEFFSYLKSRKEGNVTPNNVIMEDMLKELRDMNENHLRSLKDVINDGNVRIVKAINDGTIKQIELLGEIKGKLDK